MDSSQRKFHVHAAAAAAARGAVLSGLAGLALGVVELLLSAVAGQAGAIPSPAGYPASYVGIGLLVGAGVGPLALAIDATLRRFNVSRPRAGLLVPLVLGLIAACSGILAPAAAGAAWMSTSVAVGAFVGMWTLATAGALVVTRGNPPAEGWRGIARGVELVLLAALAVRGLSLLALHPVHGRWLVVSGVRILACPLALTLGLAAEALLLRALAPRGRAWRLLRPAALVVLALAAATLVRRERLPSATPPSGAPNVVLVVLDGARHDAVSAATRTPNATPAFDAVATAGALFEHARSPSPWCLPGHLALLSGASAPIQGVDEVAIGDFRPGRRPPSSIPTLAERLGLRGYVTAAFSNDPWVGAATGLDAGFARFFEISSPGYAAPRLKDLSARAGAGPWTSDQGAGETAGAVVSWLRNHKDRPFFLFVNLAEPMPPWTPMEPFLSPAAGPNPIKSPKELRAACENPLAYELGDVDVDWRDWDVLRALYQARVAQADAVVAKLLAALESMSLTERTFVVITSDHGQTFRREGRLLGNHFSVDEGVLRVPLAIRGPGVPAGGRVDTPVSTVDVVPTLLDLMSLPADPRLEGQSMLPLLRTGVPARREPRAFVVQYRRPAFRIQKIQALVPDGDLSPLKVDRYAVVRDNWKLVVDSGGRRRIFNLNEDPDELNTLTEGSPAFDAALPPLGAALDAWLKRLPTTTRAGSVDASLHVLDRVPMKWW